MCEVEGTKITARYPVFKPVSLPDFQIGADIGSAKSVACHFCCTTFVHYECLHKKRSEPTQSDGELCQRLRNAKRSGDFQVHSVAIDDLIDNKVLSKRQHIGKGELSSMVFARKTRQALLTDDQRARRLAAGLLDATKIQTTPHLAGWLFFTRKLVDGDLAGVITEHEALGRPLTKHFQTAYEHAMRARLGLQVSRTQINI